MKYKLEIWPYDLVNCIKGEERLNAMAADGWCFWSMLDRLHLICYKRCDNAAQRKMYAVDVFYEDSPGDRWMEEDAYKAFYEELGWEFVRKMGYGLRLFQRPYRRGIPSIHASEREPRDIVQLSAKKPKLWKIITPVVLFVIVFTWLLMNSYHYNRVAIMFTALWFLIIGEKVTPEFIGKAYVKGGDEAKLSKMQELCNKVTVWLVFLLFPVSEAASLWCLASGGVSGIGNEYLIVQALSLCALPGFIMGLFLKLIVRKSVISSVLIWGAFLGMLYGFGLLVLSV